MCVFFAIQNQKNPRHIIYLHGGEELGEADLPSGSLDADTNDDKIPDKEEDPAEFVRKQGEKLRERGIAGPKYEKQHEVPIIPNPIDPGPPSSNQNTLRDTFPNLSSIFDDLDQLKKDFFDASPDQTIDPENYRLNIDFANRTAEAFVARALVENWSREKLMYEYAGKMAEYNGICFSGTAVGKKLEKFSRRVTGELPTGVTIRGENPHLSGRILKPSDRGRLEQAMLERQEKAKMHILLTKFVNKISAGEYTKKELEARVDFDHVEFVDEVAVPFYQRYYFDRFLVMDETETQLLDAFSILIEKLYRQCLKRTN